MLTIERYARSTSVNWIPVGEFVELKIWLRGELNPIALTASFSGTAVALNDIYRQFAEKTFATRAKIYLDQLQARGFIDYGGARFFANGEVEKSGIRTDLRKARLSQSPFELVIAGSSSFAVSTRKDVDVFVSLLQRLFGVRCE